ncbi:hypothetical protein LOD99_6986 [Oopsacas minuta]|uniref:Phosducin thioredoxin-like domain-containing protein n=1 Tax=Oopsacas minuta TaxID=111878 RepID=A0AAV7JJ20_9METZ|nr:hypothetical protein LOD99_6986 [Oopsacas minuta]
MQDPNEDTEWNDILRSRGILPPKKEPAITEAEITQMIDAAAEKKQAEEIRGTAKPLEDMTIDELDAMEDIEDERALNKYRTQRMAEIMSAQAKPSFGSLLEITAHEYVTQNYPDKNLPTLFVYLEGELKFQFVGAHLFDGMNLRVQDLEWMLAERGAIITELESDPRKDREIRDAMKIGISTANRDSSDDEYD